MILLILYVELLQNDIKNNRLKKIPKDSLKTFLSCPLLSVQEVLTHFLSLSYYINWGKTSWTNSNQ